MPDIPLRFPGGGTGWLTVANEYKPGDPEPQDASYGDWQEWAEVQHKAGLRQLRCVNCGLWTYPQDLADRIVMSYPQTSDGTVVPQQHRICKKCDAKEAA